MIAPSWLIQRKRDGYELKKEEIHDFVRGVCTQEMTDYQTAAFLMAVYFKGMSLNETIALTQAMLESGERYNLSQISGIKVDKHSTGGVGDKVSLILAPLAASCGLKVPMMSGRGLGHSGGTLDKLESIPGFNVRLKKEKFEEILAKVGCAMTGQTEKIVPADKKLYALRDVTGTVECIPLIVASILSKKLAEGADALVLDVKVGSGAFMKTRAQAQKLAKSLIRVGKKMNLPTRTLLTNMSQPLGYAVGNSLEVLECIEILKNEKTTDLCSADLKALTIHLCAEMLVLGNKARGMAEGRKLAHAKLADGSAWRTFQDLVREQGGSVVSVNSPLGPQGLPIASRKTVWTAKKRGYIGKMATEEIGKILIGLGGGRKKAEDVIDPGVGLIFHKKLGSRVQIDEPLVTVYSNESLELNQLALLEASFQSSIDITQDRKPVPSLIFEQYE